MSETESLAAEKAEAVAPESAAAPEPLTERKAREPFMLVRAADNVLSNFLFMLGSGFRSLAEASLSKRGKLIVGTFGALALWQAYEHYIGYPEPVRHVGVAISNTVGSVKDAILGGDETPRPTPTPSPTNSARPS